MNFSIDIDEAAVTDLRIHPENERIYGLKDNIEQLVEWIEEEGILESIVITKDGSIISGGRRFRAAKRLGLAKVPVKVFESDDLAEIQAAIVEYNCYRVKTNRQLAAEALVYLRIEKERAARRQAMANAKDVLEKLPEHGAGTARDLAGKKLNISGKSAEKAAKVAEAADALSAAGKSEEAAELDAAINKGFDTGYKLAVQKGHIAAPKKKPKKKEEHPAEPPAEPAGELPAEINVSGNQSAELTCDVAIDLAEEILTFLEGDEAQEMSTEQKNHWSKLLDGFEEARQTLAI